jgi:hypothetical protein
MFQYQLRKSEEELEPSFPQVIEKGALWLIHFFSKDSNHCRKYLAVRSFAAWLETSNL